VLFAACCLVLLFLLLIFLRLLTWEVLKLFVWVVMLTGVRPSKISALYCLEKTHRDLLSLESTANYNDVCLTDLAKKTRELVAEIENRCKELKISPWRKNIAYWLSDY